MWAQLLEYAEAHKQTIDAGRLRYASAGGSPLDLDLKRRVEAVIGSPLNNGYGLTEYSPTVSLTRPWRPQADASCGPAIPGTQLRIADPETGAELPPGSVGELLIKGPGALLGYYRAPEATAAVLREDGWLDTGDLAQIDDAGSLHIAGRSKELIIRSGFNVYPPEVEAVLNSHPEVTQSAVVGRAIPGNEEVVAFVQFCPGAQSSSEQIAAFAAERLAPYKRPSEIVVLQEFPAGSTGKILKNKLKDMAAERTGGS
jgi:acyl-CoA synthetase (AMP-forming)/AMP-acid ligase II